MKLLLHTCCGPCSIYPVQILRDEGMEVMGYFYRHNIHPYTECLRRQETLQAYADNCGFKVIVQEGYDVEGFLRDIVFREADRCRICYHRRLTATALVARKGKFDCFSTTLLYSKFQNHAAIREIGQAVADTTGIAFHYHDFREGWKTGVTESKRLACTASNTAAASTRKKNVIIKRRVQGIEGPRVQVKINPPKTLERC